jgi:hypothetical protein
MELSREMVRWIQTSKPQSWMCVRVELPPSSSLGRVLSDLKLAAGSLEFVDAVVAENGAVIEFPNGHSKLTSPTSASR